MLTDGDGLGLRRSATRPVVPTDQPAVEHHPAAAARVFLVGYGTLTLSVVALGLLLTRALDGPVGGWDAEVNRWFVSRRTGAWDTITAALTSVLNTVPVIAIALVVVALLGWRHRWREGLLIAVSLILEVTVFLSVTVLVARSRPDVARLDSAPMTSSFPSGHTAAAVALYGSIAVVVLWCTRNRLARALAWVIAIMAVVGVGASRVYRGMHHPTDVLVGVAFGVACVWLSWLAVQTYLRRPEPAARASTPSERDAHRSTGLDPIEADVLG